MNGTELIRSGQAGALVCISKSPEKGTAKTPVDSGDLVSGHGLQGDGHAGAGKRQVSLLASESIADVSAEHPELGFGSFAENLAISGIHWSLVKVGARVRIGSDALLEITQIGKECHGEGCAVFRRVGYCIMPREGVFARVLKGGRIAIGDAIVLLDTARA